MRKILLFMAVIALISCEKDQPTLAIKSDLFENMETLFEEEDFTSSKTISISDINSNSIDLLISSTNNELIDYYLEVFEINLLVNPDLDLYNNTSAREASVSNSSSVEEFPDDWIVFEVLETNFTDESSNYSIEMKKKESMLKSYPYPPTTYYLGYKFEKQKKGKIWYFPDDTENDELLYKWGYTESWIGKWYWDTYWNYIWGFSAVHSPMEIFHPLNDVDLYRRGISMYYDDANYFHLMSY